jgi:predicted DNA-binding protein (UPF0251 family)
MIGVSRSTVLRSLELAGDTDDPTINSARDQQRLGRRVELTAEQIEYARAMIAEGVSVLVVARSIGVSRASLHRALERVEVVEP